MKKTIFLLFCIVVIMSGCTNTTEESKIATESKNITVTDNQQEKEIESEDSADSEEESSVGRKVIYNAQLTVQVENYEHTVKEIQTEAAKKKGYILNSNTYRNGEEGQLQGTMTIRIPTNAFHSFIEALESGSIKVMDRTISGQDVTEEFVDLESRLKSKQVVEKRLLDFMEKAEKTEDLLKISTDLATVQEEIEQIKGRMNYLQNQADLATVTIEMAEKSVNVPDLQSKDLNTWEKTKKQFIGSLNFILSAGSGLIVFFIGNIPVFLIIGLIIFIVFAIRKRMKKE
ncbi:DUF4349 domain-containing protein [Metabacillus fastidiosus]|uniref:DUF4349 domain-containing protein n=1 Tax=Metabacillus fastidiosus TaxID=1458 RepID=UPI003D28836B